MIRRHRARALLAALVFVVVTGCGDGGDDADDRGDDAPSTTQVDGREPTIVATDTQLVITMSPHAAPGAKADAIAACRAEKGVREVHDEGRSEEFRLDVQGSTYEEQLAIVECLASQPGIEGVHGTK